MIHVGVDLHQRFCYMTALDSRGKQLNVQAVPNEAAALRAYFRQFRKPVRAAVESCGFWPAFRAATSRACPEARPGSLLSTSCRRWLEHSPAPAPRAWEEATKTSQTTHLPYPKTPNNFLACQTC